MCGIAGVLAARPYSRSNSDSEAARLVSLIRNRGPDGEGAQLAVGRRVCFVHSRLAIIDPGKRSDQPLVDEETGAFITYNGEIYNFRTLRRELKSAGDSLKTQSDTEVILKGYLRYGCSFFNRLRGMYAFAIFDPSRDEVVAVRDALGIKPLYLNISPSEVRFGSTPLAAASAAPALEPAAAISLAVLGSVIEPLSPFVGVHQAPPGSISIFRLRPDRIETTKTTIEPAFEWRGPSADRSLAPLELAISDTVEAHFTSDVPVGVFQSAGLDSTIISSLARSGGRDPTLLTIGFEHFRGSQDDEVPGAAETAARLGLQHRYQYIADDELTEDAAAFLGAMQSPSADGFNVYLAARLCRQEGLKVALSGAGGDELLAGYPSFFQLPNLNALGFVARSRFGRSMIDAGLNLVSRVEPHRSPKLRYFSNYLADWRRRYLLRRAYFAPEELPQILHGEVIRDGYDTFWTAFEAQSERSHTQDAAGVRALEMDVYLRNTLLRDADWTGMAHGVEIRTPLVDLPLIRSLCDQGLHCPYKKDDLRILLNRLSPQARIRPREKSGFMVPHPLTMVGLPGSPPGTGPRGLRAWNRRVLAHWFPDWVMPQIH